MSTETKPDELLTLSEVAALTRLTEAAIRKYLRDDSCPLLEVRAGRYIRITRSSYDAWVKSLVTA